jgi:hypothetical protein
LAAPPPGPAALVARLRECRYQAERLRLQLAPLQARNSYLRRRLSVGPVLQAALPPDAAEPAHSPAALRRRWLARLLEAATDGLAPSAPATGSTAEALLTARQAAWLSEAAWLTAYLTGAPAMPLA